MYDHNSSDRRRGEMGNEQPPIREPSSQTHSVSAAADTELTEGIHPAEVVTTSEQTVRVAIGTESNHVDRRLLKSRLPAAYHTTGHQFEVEMRSGAVRRIRDGLTQSWTTLQR